MEVKSCLSAEVVFSKTMTNEFQNRSFVPTSKKQLPKTGRGQSHLCLKCVSRKSFRQI